MRVAELIALAIYAALVVGLAGCRREPEHPSTPSPPPTPRPKRVYLRPFPDPDHTQHYRWRDILDNPYSERFRQTTPYREGCAWHELSGGETLSGWLHVRGLKPNFAYQVKLEGRPTCPYPWPKNALRDPRNWANVQLGKLGRWWCDTCRWNVADAELKNHRGHMIYGYVLFDYFVTDGLGNADVKLSFDSSFHVVWRFDQRPRGDRDGDIRPYLVQSARDERTGEIYAYSSQVRPAVVPLYAEWEPGRPVPGQAKLPPGEYRCALLLTEESLHNAPPELAEAFPTARTNFPDGGFWAHCLVDDNLKFQVLREN